VSFYFHPDAVQELEAAAQYYADIDGALAAGFVAEVHDAIVRAEMYPEAWPALALGVRRCQLRRFPYGIVYVPDKDAILILAVMHLHREPGYWQHRTD
jgi:plasmid stabilization system protein ParE